LIHVVGLGLGDIKTLSNDALQVIANSSSVMGSKRQLSSIEDLLSHNQQQLNYPSPFAKLSTQLLTYFSEASHQDICLLASGDPLFYGISNFLLRYFSADQLHFYSNISSIQTAFERIKKPWQQAKIISLHGRPLSNLIPHLAHHPLIALLTDKYSHPQAIAKLLCEYGCDDAQLSVCESLGTEDEKVTSFIANKLVTNSIQFHSLQITIIEIKNSHCILPSFPGFDDTLFFTDSDQAGKGMMSKREVRLVALSLLQPKVNDIAWDIGAGCGTIAVEWAYWNQQGTIYAIEHHAKRLSCLDKNKQKFGVNNLHIIANKAPTGLDHLPRPNAVFIGGSAGELVAIMDYCWEQLLSGGCLVINCVTENCKSDLQHWLQQQTISNDSLEWTDISVSKDDQLAGQLLMRPRLPVRLLRIKKNS
jgi:precorrin-6Y C5,15-methyltransferase (decarboxylating)